MRGSSLPISEAQNLSSFPAKSAITRFSTLARRRERSSFHNSSWTTRVSAVWPCTGRLPKWLSGSSKKNSQNPKRQPAESIWHHRVGITSPPELHIAGLFSCAHQIDEAPPRNFGHETALVRRHAIVHHFSSKLLRLFRRLTHVACGKGWTWVVFDDQLDCLGLRAAGNFACQPKRQVDPCGHPGSRNNFAGPHNTLLWLRFGAHNLQHAHLVPVRRRRQTLQDTGRSQNQCARTDRSSPSGRLVCLTQPFKHLIVYHLARCCCASRYKHQIGSWRFG